VEPILTVSTKGHGTRNPHFRGLKIWEIEGIEKKERSKPELSKRALAIDLSVS
jgi:hypothetical protein